MIFAQILWVSATLNLHSHCNFTGNPITTLDYTFQIMSRPLHKILAVTGVFSLSTRGKGSSLAFIMFWSGLSNKIRHLTRQNTACSDFLHYVMVNEPIRIDHLQMKQICFLAGNFRRKKIKIITFSFSRRSVFILDFLGILAFTLLAVNSMIKCLFIWILN